MDDFFLIHVQKNFVKSKKCIVEGRLVGWLAYGNDISAFKILITAKKDIRHNRIVLRDRNKENKEMILKR